MKRLLCIIALMFALVCMLTSCSDNEPTVSVNDDGFVVVNGVTTNIVANKDDVITVDDDGYVIVNGTKTEHKIHTTDEISVNEDGFVVVNGAVTEIIAYKDDIITVDANGYIVVNEVKTEFLALKGHKHILSEWTNNTATCEYDGTQTRNCTVTGCDYEETEVKKRNGHNFADCVCTVCGTKYSSGLEFEFLGIYYNFVGFGTCTDDEIVIPSEINGYPVIFNLEAFKYTDATKVTFLNGVKSLTMFGRLSNLKYIEIPESVEIIPIEEFIYDCRALVEINVSDKNQYYASVDGVLYSKDKTVIIAYPEGKNQAHYELPAGVVMIAPNAFALYSTTVFKEITIPRSVKYIGDNAFAYCASLTDIYYEGTEDEWNEINIVSDTFDNVTIHYNYTP